MLRFCFVATENQPVTSKTTKPARILPSGRRAGAETRQDAAHELEVQSLPDLAEAACEDEIQEPEGFGQVTDRRMLEEVERQRALEKRMLLSEVREIAVSLRDFLADVKGVESVVIAGDHRRRKGGFGDLESLHKVDEVRLHKIDAVGREITRSVSGSFHDPEDRQVFDRLKKAGLRAQNLPQADEPLRKDKTFVFTGTLDG